jgi:hypothetical protein
MIPFAGPAFGRSIRFSDKALRESTEERKRESVEKGKAGCRGRQLPPYPVAFALSFFRAFVRNAGQINGPPAFGPAAREEEKITR